MYVFPWQSKEQRVFLSMLLGNLDAVHIWTVFIGDVPLVIDNGCDSNSGATYNTGQRQSSVLNYDSS